MTKTISNSTIITLKTWEEFVEEIKKRDEEIKELEKRQTGYVSPYFLYRGQSNSDWKLQTTLERYLNAKELSVEDYDHLLRAAYAPINSYTLKFENLYEELEKEDSANKNIFFLGLSRKKLAYMTYLRHYGFPSPLLDWSKSPYVAAYFAFENEPTSKDVAIYASLEHIGNGKSGWGGDPQVIAIGPHIATDKRHFNQQSHYTLCRKKIDSNPFYCSHEEVLQGASYEEDLQDRWYKFLIPSSERLKVLNQLDLMNINAYSLYHSEEALMKTIAFRELEEYKKKD